VPFGWEMDKKRILVQIKAQQKIIQAIIAMCLGRWCWGDISKKLNAEFNIHLSHPAVQRILDSNEKNKKALLAVKNEE
jgi:hypothetical protein